ncbi:MULTISPECIES: ABC transporter ATP-binding protein [unclassified Granulicatella]|uniref:ABC transporter ATP-binding protein n=1 Tax=unclassified Granulicatella TaxID=2630493 RepID=UPI001073801A|nr:MULTISPECIES: ABC transporter ATP-binding protein [unclassified Granulicatella]MBF0779866.1 ABC transporter ATP-binding protein [Granulicatella sp. 19428wC4_WM01]TFU96070.1 ABC transporter ATP-binding protein [Granulicatella sp. WM01]
MITIKELTFQYSTNQDMTFSISDVEIKQGECVVLCGKSGSGKSTFLRLINGLIPEYYEGTLQAQAWINHQPLGHISIEDSTYSVGSVFQNPSTQFFHDIIEDELVFPCENQGLPVDVIQCRLHQIVKKFQLDHLLHHSLYHISGGQRQKVAIATALMQQPYMIVMDEPTANLDKHGVDIIKETIEQLKRAGITIIIAEQRLAYLRDVADKYLYFERGTLVQQWDKQTILTLSNDFFHHQGLRSPLLDSVYACLDEKKHLFQEVQHKKVPSLCLKDIQLKYGQTVIKHFPAIQFPLGQIIGIVGANGVGKTTLIKAIAGLLHSKGTFLWNGKSLSEQERLKQTSFVLQEVRMQLFSDTVNKEIELGADKNLVRLHKETVCQTLGLMHVLDKHPMTLSGGQQQRVMMANALLSQKKVFIFDEVTSGLCYENMQNVANLIKTLKKSDSVVFLVSHDEEFLSYAADMIFDMEQEHWAKIDDDRV